MMLLLPATTLTRLNAVQHCRASTLLNALGDASVDLIAVDPPYGCGTQVSAWRSPEERFAEIKGVDEIDNTWLPNAYRALKPTGAIYLFAKWVNMGDWKRDMETVGFKVRNCIIWDKLQHGTGDLQGAYAPQYEMILFGVKESHKLRGKRHPDIIRYPKVQPTDLVHPYEKPVGLIEYLIEKSTDKGALVVDCFAGSGATGQAARNTGRDYILAELEANYVNLAQRRVDMPFTPLMIAEAA